MMFSSTLRRLLGASLFLAALCGSAQAQQSQLLVHQASGNCIDVAGQPAIANGSKIQLVPCENSGKSPNGSASDQTWYLQNGFIRNGVSAKCIDVPGAPGIKEGLKVILYDCELSGRNPNGSQTDQQWDFANGQFKHRLSGLCLGPERTEYTNHVALMLTRCAKPGAADLEFAFRPLGAAPAAAKAPAAAPAPVAAAKPGKPQLIYPDVAGASQTCIIPVDPATRRYKVAVTSSLALENCSKGDQGTIFQVTKTAIRVVGKGNLCVNIGAGRQNGIPYLENCADTEVKNWDVPAVSGSAQRIRSVGGMWDNLCWAAPDIENSKARWPIDIVAVPCRAGKDQRFFVSVD